MPEVSSQEQADNLREMARIAEDVNGRHCKNCDGSGRSGWIVTANRYEVCGCIQKAVEKVRKEKQKEVHKEVMPEEKN